MDRLSIIRAAVLLTALCILQCKSESTAAPPPPRVVAVKAKQTTEDPLPAFCDFLDKQGTQKAMKMPEINGRVAGAPMGFRWINIWATWCKPCIAEMPSIVEWTDKLNKAGYDLAVEFVSVDEDPEVLNRFYQERPAFPTSGRLADPEALTPWIAEMGLDAGAGLPIHIFVDPKGMIRCARAAAVNPQDFAAVEALIR